MAHRASVPAPLPRFASPAVLELLKPITWFPPLWAFGCGIVSAGPTQGTGWPVLLVGFALAGPLVCGTSQAVNDWFDREVDAVNEPGRPIPSGRLPGRTALGVALGGTLLSLAVALVLGGWVLAATLLGLALAWAYSAPPLRLKRDGWSGNTAVAVSYEGLAWFTGAAIVTNGFPDAEIVLVAALYSLGAHGIMTLNDFKSVEGDRRMGIRSIPVQLGEVRAARLACWVMTLPQVAVVLLLAGWNAPLHAVAVAALLVGQVVLMSRFLLAPQLLARPRENAALYNATGTTLYVLGMLVTALALRGAAA
jgi:chlorophyll/bacteriochlorophyll a synthase